MDDVIAGAQGLVSFASSALSLSNGLQKLVGGTKAEAEVSKLHGVIVATHQSALAAIRDQINLEQEKLKLEKRLDAYERWDAEVEKYELTSVGPGVVAYRLKTESDREPSHLLCPNCFEQKRKAYIQRSSQTQYARALDAYLHIHHCSACSTKYEFGISHRARTKPVVARGYDPLT